MDLPHQRVFWWQLASQWCNMAILSPKKLKYTAPQANDGVEQHHSGGNASVDLYDAH